MKRILINDNYMNQNDMEDEVIRVKALIINSKNELLLAHNNYTFQFPGGHKEDNETLENTLLREIKEETGISVNSLPKPFVEVITYDDNYFNSGKKVCNKIYYYKVLTDEVPNIAETHYDELESLTDFNLFYINMSDLKEFLNKSIEDKNISYDIGREMLLVDKVYKELYC